MRKFALVVCVSVILLQLLIPDTTLAVGTNVGPVRLSVRNAPVPVMLDGKLQVVYEVHIENKGGLPLLPLQLTVARQGQESSPAIVYAGDELLANMEFFDHSYRGANRDYLRDSREDPNTIGASMIGVVYVWLTLDAPMTFPSNWVHEITLAQIDSAVDAEADATAHIKTNAGGEPLKIAGGAFTVSPRAPVRIGPPLEGGPWWAMESMGNNAVHRRAMVLEMANISQRYGVDYIMLGDSGSPFAGDDMSRLVQWYGYGKNVIAVADGVVTDVNDGLPDNTPGAAEKAVAISADTINGNYVVLDIGNGHFAAYAHMAPGSVRVKLGQAVKKGEVLGLLGSSGNSGGPHLHFHISTGNHIFDAEGLPFVYETFDSVGTTSTEQLQATGFHAAPAQPGAKPDTRLNEIPGYNAVIVFPGGNQDAQ